MILRVVLILIELFVFLSLFKEYILNQTNLDMDFQASSKYFQNMYRISRSNKENTCNYDKYLPSILLNKYIISNDFSQFLFQIDQLNFS